MARAKETFVPGVFLDLCLDVTNKHTVELLAWEKEGIFVVW